MKGFRVSELGCGIMLPQLGLGEVSISRLQGLQGFGGVRVGPCRVEGQDSGVIAF